METTENGTLWQNGAGGDLGMNGQHASPSFSGSGAPGLAGRAVIGDSLVNFIDEGDIIGARIN